MATLSLPSSSPSLSWPLPDSHLTLNPNFISSSLNPEPLESDFIPPILPPPEDRYQEHEAYLPVISSPCRNPIPNPNPNPNPIKPDSVTDFVSPVSIPTLLNISFNQDFGCFSAGTDRGFRVYNCDPFREIFRRDFDRGVGIVEMLFRCNILVVVGGGPDPQFPLNKVMIWDDNQSRCIGDLSFRSEVRAVKLRRDRIVVVLEHKIFVYNFADLKLLHQIETTANLKGLCAVSQGSGPWVLVCPGLQTGQIRVEHYGSKKTKFIRAHDTRIACFALTQDGRVLATASTKGTLVRVFNTVDGTLLQEVRRGADRAEIYSLAFSADARWLAASSDKGTVHVFRLKVNQVTLGMDGPQTVSGADLTSSLLGPNRSSSLSFIRGVLPKYFRSEWSLAQFHLHEGSRYMVAFGHQKHTIVILGLDGSVYRCRFDPVNGGEMDQLEFYNFLETKDLLVAI